MITAKQINILSTENVNYTVGANYSDWVGGDYDIDNYIASRGQIQNSEYVIGDDYTSGSTRKASAYAINSFATTRLSDFDNSTREYYMPDALCAGYDELTFPLDYALLMRTGYSSGTIQIPDDSVMLIRSMRIDHIPVFVGNKVWYYKIYCIHGLWGAGAYSENEGARVYVVEDDDYGLPDIKINIESYRNHSKYSNSDITNMTETENLIKTSYSDCPNILNYIEDLKSRTLGVVYGATVVAYYESRIHKKTYGTKGIGVYNFSETLPEVYGAYAHQYGYGSTGGTSTLTGIIPFATENAYHAARATHFTWNFKYTK